LGVGQAELLEPPDGVVHLDDLVVAQPEDETSSTRSKRRPVGARPATAQVGGRVGEAAHHLVAFGDQLHDLHVDVGKLTRNGAIHRLAAGASSGAYSSSITSSRPPLRTSSISRRMMALLCSITDAPRAVAAQLGRTPGRIWDRRLAPSGPPGRGHHSPVDIKGMTSVTGDITAAGVHTSDLRFWCPRQDSNLQPTD
jgi:hypothetical protein